MPTLSTAQKTALDLVQKGEVKYVHFPLSHKDKPYFIVQGRRSSDTRTYKSLMKRSLTRAAPSLRAAVVVLTASGVKVAAQ
jgi:hypothetical protein